VESRHGHAGGVGHAGNSRDMSTGQFSLNIPGTKGRRSVDGRHGVGAPAKSAGVPKGSRRRGKSAGKLSLGHGRAQGRVPPPTGEPPSRHPFRDGVVVEKVLGRLNVPRPIVKIVPIKVHRSVGVQGQSQRFLGNEQVDAKRAERGPEGRAAEILLRGRRRVGPGTPLPDPRGPHELSEPVVKNESLPETHGVIPRHQRGSGPVHSDGDRRLESAPFPYRAVRKRRPHGGALGQGGGRHRAPAKAGAGRNVPVVAERPRRVPIGVPRRIHFPGSNPPIPGPGREFRVLAIVPVFQPAFIDGDGVLLGPGGSHRRRR
jgi:hypothetical protein